MKATPTLPIIMQELNSSMLKSIQLMRNNSKDSSGSTQITYSIKKKQQGDAVKHA